MNKKLICAIFEIQFSDDFTPEQMVHILHDYLLMNKFTQGEIKVTAYPIDYNLSITPLITNERKM